MSHNETRSVRELLEAAGLRPTEEELLLLEAIYPILRERIDRLHNADLGDEG